MGGYLVRKEYHKSKGFTLIELMIVIAIVAILVALAVPAYQDYIIRAKVTECVAASAPAKTSISEFRQTIGRWPTNNSEAALIEQFTEVSEYCAYFLYRAGNGGTGDFLIKMNVGADESQEIIRIVMSPEIADSGNINWNCTRYGSETVNLKYLPASCRDAPIWQND